MSRDASPPPSSDDSAVGSIASSNRTTNQTPYSRTYSRIDQNRHSIPTDNQTINQGATFNPAQERVGHESNIRVSVAPDELRMASKQMRYNNTTLLSRSIRTNLSCFDDLDIQRLNYHTEYLVNFISIGINKCVHSIQRPVSILWPDTYDRMIDGVAKLDAMLINTELKENPIEWMLQRGLTTKPECKLCKNQMELKYEGKTVSWRCNRTQACQTLYAPIQRPIFFKGHESVGLIKLLFAIYYWSICTQCDLLYSHLKLEPETLSAIYQGIQNVCRLALEKSYPRFRLCNNPETDENQITQLKESSELIDLISIKINNCFVVCAKHPRSNCVRLGLMIPDVSKYKFMELTESWFAHGAQIRICETKFLGLKSLRPDLTVVLTTRSEMVTKNGVFNRESAFGYIICQFSHIFKDFDSSKVPQETLKLILAELEWRELYGTNPYDAFTKIVEHMSTYRSASHCYYELPKNGECDIFHDICIRDESDYIFAEKYFYANMQPVDAQGKVIQRYGTKEDYNEYPISIVQFECHLCSGLRHESFYFSMHIIAHVENNRRDNEEAEYHKTRHIKCKHCFRKFKKQDMIDHSKLFRTDFVTMKYGCRICCIKFGNRSEYLNHMRRTHFEHEMPYRCPICKYASSFQRETVIHFQEEHQQDYIIMCPFCLRSFTIPKPAELDSARMKRVSRAIYNHILQHYALADSFKCDSCCLCFLNAAALRKHKTDHHNPMETFSEQEVKVQPFIVTIGEEEHCVQALPMELFIPNKRPNMAIDEATQATNSSLNLIHGEHDARGATKRSRPSTLPIAEESCAGVDEFSEDYSSDDEKHRLIDCEGGTIHVGPSASTRSFLDGGNPDLRIFKTKPNFKDWTTERIIEALSKMTRADSIIPNQSVILLPNGQPARCVECTEYITIDHYVAAIMCKPCKYETHCPRAATRHKQSKHASCNEDQ